MPILLVVAQALALTVLVGIAVAGMAPAWLDEWCLTIVIGTAAVSILWRGARVAEGRTAWLLVGSSVAVYAAGCVLFNVMYRGALHPPFPSVADAFWLTVQPCTALALVLEARRAGARPGLAELLDGLVCAFALAAVCGVVVYEPIFANAVEHAVTFSLVQVLVDLAVVAVVIVHLSATGWRPDRMTALVGLGFLALSVGDSLYAIEAATSRYDPGTFTDVPYGLCMIALGFAAWEPPRAAQAPGTGVLNLAIPLTAGLVGVALTAVALISPLNPVAEGAILLLLLTVVVRAAQAMRAYGGLLATKVREAATDALTGLPNRRRLVGDVARDLAAGRRQALALFDLDGFKSYNDTFGHTSGDALLGCLARALQSAVDGRAIAYRMGGDEFCVLMEAGDADATIAAVARALTHAEGDVEISSSWGVVLLPDEATSFAEALGIADRRMYAMKNGRPRSAGSQLRDVLVRVLDIREPDLHDHVLDVGRLAGGVARRLGLPEHEITDIVHGAVLHDVGKLAVPAEILDKPGPLDEAEWKIMRRHTIEGEQFLAGIPALANVARLVRSSHERWDGAGYPDGLAGDDVPLGARIITVCDAYDAMVTDRPYRRGMPPADALAELRRCAGSHFDARVVGAFCAMIETGPAAASLRLAA